MPEKPTDNEPIELDRAEVAPSGGLNEDATETLLDGESARCAPRFHRHSHASRCTSRAPVRHTSATPTRAAKVDHPGRDQHASRVALELGSV